MARAVPTDTLLRSMIAIVAMTAALLGLAACERSSAPTVAGNVENGRLLLRQFGCGSCHQIPGVAQADGIVGPPLAGVGRRVYIGGFVPNTPDNMMAWIRSPKSIDPGTAMPDLQLAEAHARDMVAYLFTLK